MTSTLALLNPTGFVSSSGYVAIFILSVLQSCCVPTSSELTLGFGGVLASQGTLSLPGVIVAGAAGEVVGAYIAWAIGRAGGRPLVERYGRYVLLSPRDLDRAEDWYARHERWGVLGSRLLPVIRNFVAVPAGVAQVPAARFGVLTAAGSLIWDAAMALIGYGIGGQWKTVMKGFSDAGYLLGAVAVAAIALVIWHRWRSYRADTGSAPSAAAPAGRSTGARSTGARSTGARSVAADLRRPVAPEGSGAKVRSRRSRNAALRKLKVPGRITGSFWAAKLLSTAMGEALSDSLVHGINRYLAVIIGFVLFVVAMRRQLTSRRYNPRTYWLAVAMVAVFGTMAADVMHIVLHIPYIVSTLFFAVALAVILRSWYRSEGTLSIHSIYTSRRELYYWGTVLATFALGTALGDLTATTFHLGYLGSGLMFIVAFAVPGAAYYYGRMGSVAAFWASYILTRPLGASFADWLGFPRSVGGVGLGHPLTAVLFAIPLLAVIAYIGSSRIDASYPAADRLARLQPEFAD